MTIHYRKHTFHSEKKQSWGKETRNPFLLTPHLKDCNEEALRAYARWCRNYSISDKPDGDYDDERLKPFQKHGVAELLRRKNVLLADEMGLGKTVQCCVALEELKPRTLIICPAFLVLNWGNEIRKWTSLRVQTILNGRTELTDAQVAVISYANVSKYRQLLEERWEVLICDEGHFLKNPKAKRTKAVSAIFAQRKWILSGTPMRNRPRDLYPIMRMLLGGFSNFHDFARRYCAAKQEFIPGRGMVWDYDGASNTEELHTFLRSTVMIRRMKEKVLTQLPAKIEQVILLEDAKIVRAEKTAMKGVPQDASRLEAEYTATIRRNTAVAKLPEVKNFVEKLLEEVDKVVLFAYHRDMMNELGAHFSEVAVQIDGRTPTKERQERVNRFQSDPECRVFVGQIEACGTGLTLTAAHTVVFAETTWTPSDMAQAADRCHRIGQTRPVNVYTLLTRGTIDEAVHRALQNKSLTIKECLEQARRVHK